MVDITMVKFTDIEDAFFFVSSDQYGMNTAILNKVTGGIYYRSEMGDIDEIDENDLDWDNCIKIPHKNDLELGRELVFEFVETHMPDEYDRVWHMFRKRGAYGRFKSLLESRGLLQSWFAFESQREEQALREWCKENGIELSE
jgi:tRNA splicing endonuclease